ncbi:hypothetical protein BDV93DRAFT_402811, partial [Ceratobasidium sp. AG-I]
MALPKDLPTLQSTSSKNYTRPDNVFISSPLAESLISCSTCPETRPPCTDHLPIATVLDVTPLQACHTPRPNFAKADWHLYRSRLKELLASLPGLQLVKTQAELDDRVSAIRTAISQAVKDSIPTLTLDIRSKRWWTKELKAHRREVRSLAAQSFRVRWDQNHSVHAQFKTQRNLY